jgi:hypothetical protein
MTDPWRARHFGAGYSAEYLPCGLRTWRILRQKGEVHVFPTRAQAQEAAKEAYLRTVEPTIRATLPVDPEKVAAKLQDEAENWLKSKREDVKAAHTVHRPGKKAFRVMKGRAIA